MKKSRKNGSKRGYIRSGQSQKVGVNSKVLFIDAMIALIEVF